MFSGLRLKADGKAFMRTRPPALDQIQKGDDGDETHRRKKFCARVAMAPEVFEATKTTFDDDDTDSGANMIDVRQSFSFHCVASDG
jgi:hypothetical protein